MQARAVSLVLLAAVLAGAGCTSDSGAAGPTDPKPGAPTATPADGSPAVVPGTPTPGMPGDGLVGEPAAGTGGAVGGSAGTGAGPAREPVDDGSAGGDPVGEAGTDDPAPPTSDPDPATPAAPTSGAFPAVTDFASAGPYTSTTLLNVGPGNNYAVYYPAEPVPEGAKNPIVAWTSGGGTSHVFYTLLPHLASHGFVVISSNTIPGIGAEAQLGQEMLAGIDWLLAENERAGSELSGRLDTAMIAASGYSMGSLATFTIAMDARLVTTVHISGGNMAPERVQNLHAPAAFICGNPNPACTNLLDATCDIAGANCATDFDNATTSVFYATFDAGHLGILTSPFMERINAMTTAWLRHYLMGDTSIAGMFEGASCDYCTDSNWTIRKKNYD